MWFTAQGAVSVCSWKSFTFRQIPLN